MIGRLNGWMIGWSDGRMDGYLAWMVGYLVEWLDGRKAELFNDRMVGSKPCAP